MTAAFSFYLYAEIKEPESLINHLFIEQICESTTLCTARSSTQLNNRTFIQFHTVKQAAVSYNATEFKKSLGKKLQPGISDLLGVCYSENFQGWIEHTVTVWRVEKTVPSGGNFRAAERGSGGRITGLKLNILRKWHDQWRRTPWLSNRPLWDWGLLKKWIHVLYLNI